LLSKLPLTLSSGSHAVASMCKPSRIANGVLILAAVEAPQRHAFRVAARRAGVNLGLEPRHQRSRGRLSGRRAPAGGIRPPRSLRITFSAISAC
jgi:hypothetical protein